MNIYIIGEIDHQDINESCGFFMAAEKQLRQQGHTPIHIMYDEDWQQDQAYETKLRIGKLADCDAVFVMDSWQHDKIAQHEFALAITLGKQFVFSNTVNTLPRRIDFFIPPTLKTA